MWAILSRNRDTGLLMLRIWLGGVYFWAHAYPMLFRGDVVKTWETVGKSIQNWGITIPGPMFWGFMAMLINNGGILLFILGMLFRPACLLLALVMAVAATARFLADKGSIMGFVQPFHAVELGILFLCMMFIGPGRYSFDRE
jgi:putative oxidoreductase